MDNNSKSFEEIWSEAYGAALAASKHSEPTPMVVSDQKNAYYVSEGMCGFAWIWFSKATTPFTRWLRKTGKGHKHYNGGWDVSMGSEMGGSHGQSVERKEAAARAFADVIRKYLPDEKCYAQSRLD